MWMQTVTPASLSFADMQAAINNISPTGTPTIIDVPAGVAPTYTRALRKDGKSNIWFRMKSNTYLKWSAAMSGAAGGLDAQGDHCSLIQAINNVSTPHAAKQKNLWFSGGNIDASLQNAGGISGDGSGLNFLAIECQDVDFAKGGVAGEPPLNINDGYGGAFVSGSIDPSTAWAVKAATVENMVATRCSRGALGSAYGGIFGSVVQIGADGGGYMRNVRGVNIGGPLLSAFNVLNDFAFEYNSVSGIYQTDTYPASFQGQPGALLQSDFGFNYSRARFNVAADAGGFYFQGLMIPQFVNNYTATPGAQYSRFEQNRVSDTGLAETAPSVVGAGVYENPLLVPLAVRFVGGATVQPQISVHGAGVWVSVTKTGSSSYEGKQFLVPVGYDYQFITASPSSFQTYAAPNAARPHYFFNAGNFVATGVTTASTATTLSYTGTSTLLGGTGIPDSIFAGYVVTMTSGACNGQSRTVGGSVGAASATTGRFTGMTAWVGGPPSAGDTFTVHTAIPGYVQSNQFDGNKSFRSPIEAVHMYDGRQNEWFGKWRIENPGDWTASRAIWSLDSALFSGTGNRSNIWRGDRVHNATSGAGIYDTRSTKKLISNYYEDSGNSVDNIFADVRMETGTTSSYEVNTAARFYRARNYGPGAVTADMARLLPSEMTGGAVPARPMRPGTVTRIGQPR